MGKWKTVGKWLGRLGITAAGGAVEHVTGGIIPAEVIDRRRAFKQWPPRPDEVAAGEGGGTSPGVTWEKALELGVLWCQIRGRELSKESIERATLQAVEYVGDKYGWRPPGAEGWNPYRVLELDIDQFYVIRHALTQWRDTGKQPEWPKPSTVDHNALAAEYQRAVEAVNRPWTPPEQTQTQQAPTPAADVDNSAPDERYGPVVPPQHPELIAHTRYGGRINRCICYDGYPKPLPRGFKPPAVCAWCQKFNQGVSMPPPPLPPPEMPLPARDETLPDNYNNTGYPIGRRCRCGKTYTIEPGEMLYRVCPLCVAAVAAALAEKQTPTGD